MNALIIVYSYRAAAIVESLGNAVPRGTIMNFLVRVLLYPGRSA